MGIFTNPEDDDIDTEATGLRNKNIGDEDDIIERPADEDEENGEDEMEEDEDDELQRAKKLTDYERKAIQVKWWNEEDSSIFAILYRRMLEVYDMSCKGSTDVPCSRTVLDREATSFDFITKDALVIADKSSDLFILKNIHD